MTSSGERATFERYAAERYPALRRLAFLLCGDWHAAEDVVQDALLRCERRWDRIDADDPHAYVRRAVVNGASSWRQRRRRHLPLEETWAGPDAVAATDDRQVLLQALRGLPARQRQVLVLRFYEQLTEAEIATALGIAVGTVKSRAARGLSALRAAGLREIHPSQGAMHD